ncbi:DUF1427 family protein [Pseudomonas aeruginosa]
MGPNPASGPPPCRPVSPAARPRRRTKMKLYVLSLGAGLLVGIVYSLLQVRSRGSAAGGAGGVVPASCLGEQVIPVGKQLLGGCAFASRPATKAGSVGHVLGQLPGRHRFSDQAAGPSEKERVERYIIE